MSAPFQPGDVVVCVDDSPAKFVRSEHAKKLVEKICRLGAVYRVEAVRVAWKGPLSGHLVLTFHGVDSSPAAGFHATRFRKIENDTGFDFREQMRALKPLKQREGV